MNTSNLGASCGVNGNRLSGSHLNSIRTSWGKKPEKQKLERTIPITWKRSSGKNEKSFAIAA